MWMCVPVWAQSGGPVGFGKARLDKYGGEDGSDFYLRLIDSCRPFMAPVPLFFVMSPVMGVSCGREGGREGEGARESARARVIRTFHSKGRVLL